MSDKGFEEQIRAIVGEDQSQEAMRTLGRNAASLLRGIHEEGIEGVDALMLAVGLFESMLRVNKEFEA